MKNVMWIPLMFVSMPMIACNVFGPASGETAMTGGGTAIDNAIISSFSCPSSSFELQYIEEFHIADKLTCNEVILGSNSQGTNGTSLQGSPISEFLISMQTLDCSSYEECLNKVVADEPQTSWTGPNGAYFQMELLIDKPAVTVLISTGADRGSPGAPTLGMVAWVKWRPEFVPSGYSTEGLLGNIYLPMTTLGSPDAVSVVDMPWEHLE